MIRSLALGLLALLIAAGPLRAEAPPSVAPGMPVGTGLQAVAIYDAAGSIVTSFGGAGGGATTANQGTPGAAAWPMVIWQGGSPLSSGNPIFVQVASGTVTANLGTLNGAATAAAQGTGNASLASIDGKTPTLVSGRQPVDGSGVTQPISAASLPLPTGAATAAGQSAQQGSVAPGAAAASSVLGGQIYSTSPPAPANGQQLALQSDGAGNLKVNNATLPPGASTSAAQTTGNASLASIDGKAPALVSGRVPVDGSGVTQPVMQQDASAPAGSPFSASALATFFSVDTTGYQSVAVQISGTFSATVFYETSNDNTNWIAAAGQLTSSNGVTVPSTTDQSPAVRVFPVTGRYFRARVTVYTSGTVTAAPVLRSTPVAPLGVGVTNTPTVSGVRTAGTNRSLTVGTTAATAMAANTSRSGWKVKNDNATGDVWINFDGTATATPGGGNLKVAAGNYLASEPTFVETGAMSIIGSTAGLAVTIREH